MGRLEDGLRQTSQGSSIKTIEEVRDFWENNPLWTGESAHETGSRDFFEEHAKVYIDDCFAGKFDEKTIPKVPPEAKVLDLGCGPGFWVIQLAQRGGRNLVAADLTENALQLARKRVEAYGCSGVEFSRQNAEQLTFATNSFDHVNCQGVIHHTPNTEQCVAEIARVIKPGGTACISVYYKNFLLRNWKLLSWMGKIVNKVGGGLKGRGRENIYATTDTNEIVRLFDGVENPIGKAYSQKEFKAMLEPYFTSEQTFLHFFPARSLPIPLPKVLHRVLDGTLGFMIYAFLTKK